MAYKNKETELKYYKSYYLDNLEDIKKRKAERYQKRKDYIKEWSRNKYQENKEVYSARSKVYSKTEKARFTALLKSAKRRSYEVTITFEEFKDIVSKPCSYCGDIKLMGVDRENNSIGYSKNNSKPCCKVCNIMKNVLSLEEFKEHIKKIYSIINK